MFRISLKRTIAVVICLTLLSSPVFASVTAEQENGSNITQSSLIQLESSNNDANKSEARLKYESLLTGNYRNAELVSKFVELFGDISPDYIEENYKSIFDVEEWEIDEGFLSIVTNEELRGTSSLVLNEQINGNSISSASRVPTSNLREAVLNELVEKYPYDEYMPEIPTPALPDVQEDIAINQVYTPFISNEIDSIQIDDEPEIISNSGGPLLSAVTADSNGFTSITYVSKTNTSVTFSIWYKNNSDVNNILQMYDAGGQTWSYLLGREGKPAATSRTYTATGLRAGGVYKFKATTYDFPSASWKDSIIVIQTSGARNPTISVTSVNTTSFTVNVNFPSESTWGNRLEMYHWLPGTWSDVTGLGLYANSGTYTVSNLVPGERYRLYFRYYDHLESYWPAETSNTYVDLRLPLPTEIIQSYSKSNVNFSLDKCLVDQLNKSSGRLDRFMTKTNASYDTMYNLVGGAKPYSGAKMQILSTRTLPLEYEGRAGQPIQWNTTGLYFGSPSHALRMNQLNTDLTEAPLHEISHNFDSWKWTFEPEALADFKVFYYFKKSGESFAVCNTSQLFSGGNGYKNYIKSYANRLLGQISYDAAVSQGVYSPYILAYRMACIYDQIGENAFKQTFRYFDQLGSNYIPSTNIGKFNMFFSKLYDYSGQNVFNMFTAQEKNIIQARLGGSMAYMYAPFTTQETISRANALIKEHNGSTYNVGEQIAPLYDENGTLIAFSLPFRNDTSAYSGHILVGANMANLPFYLIDENISAYNEIIKYTNWNYKVVYEAPIYYYINYSNPGLNSVSAALSAPANSSRVEGVSELTDVIELEDVSELREERERAVGIISDISEEEDGVFISEDNRQKNLAFMNELANGSSVPSQSASGNYTYKLYTEGAGAEQKCCCSHLLSSSCSPFLPYLARLFCLNQESSGSA